MGWIKSLYLCILVYTKIGQWKRSAFVNSESLSLGKDFKSLPPPLAVFSQNNVNLIKGVDILKKCLLLFVVSLLLYIYWYWYIPLTFFLQQFYLKVKLECFLINRVTLILSDPFQEQQWSTFIRKINWATSRLMAAFYSSQRGPRI